MEVATSMLCYPPLGGFFRDRRANSMARASFAQPVQTTQMGEDV